MAYRVAWLQVQFLQCLQRIITFQSSLEGQRYQKMAGTLYRYQLMCSQIPNSSMVLLARKVSSDKQWPLVHPASAFSNPVSSWRLWPEETGSQLYKLATDHMNRWPCEYTRARTHYDPLYFYFLFSFKSHVWTLSKYVAMSLMSGIMAIYLCYTRKEPSPFAMHSEVLTYTQKERSICLVWILNKQLCVCFWHLGAGCWQPTQNETTGIHAVLGRLQVSAEFPSQRKPQAFSQLRFPWQPQHRENGAQSWNLLANGSR